MSNDLYLTIAIDTREAQFGTTRVLSLPGGQHATVSIPTDAYEGQILWFPGSVRESEQDTQPDTLFLTVQVTQEQASGASELASAALPVSPITSPPSDQQWSFSSKSDGGSQGRRIDKIVMLALAALIIMVSSGATFFYIHTTRSIAQAKATATAFSATAISYRLDATATGIVRGTQTASFATATVQAQATAAVVAANPDPYANGKLVYFDRLDGMEDDATQTRWTENNGCLLSDGALHILADDPRHLKECPVPDMLAIHDFTLEVSTSVLIGDTAQICFRCDAKQETGYYFTIDTAGYYSLMRLGSQTSVRSGKYTYLLNGPSAAIKPGYNQVNLLALVAQGSTLTIYINGLKIGSATDTNFDSGTISLVAATYLDHTGGTQATFANLRIWQIGA